MSTCAFCGEAISLNRTWPSGTMKWQAHHPVFTWWSFCPTVDGREHQPLTATDQAFLMEAGVAT